MRSKLGNIPGPLCASLLTISASRFLPPRVGQVKQAAKPWVCQRCLYSHYNLKPLRPRAASFAPAFNEDRTVSIRSPRTRKTWLSTSPRRPANDDGAQLPRKDLPSQEEGRRSQASKRFSHVMDHLQSNIFIAGQRLNDLTGYSGIEALKKDIEEQGQSCLLQEGPLL